MGRTANPLGEKGVAPEFVIGLCSGLRSTTPLALVAHAVARGRITPHRKVAALGKPPVATALAAIAVAELVYDKLPQARSRTSLPGLLGRLVTGSAVGATIASARGGGLGRGGVAGGLGAILGCYGGHYLRTRLSRWLPVPGTAVALAEDALTIAGSLAVLGSKPVEREA